MSAERTSAISSASGCFVHFRRFACFAVPYGVIWFTLSAFFNDRFFIDELHIYAYADYWAVGAHHPMLPGWFLNIFRILTFDSSASRLLACLTLILFTLWAVYELSSEFFRDDKTAIVITIISASILHLTFLGKTVFNHSYCLAALDTLAFLYFYRALVYRKQRYWILTGMMLGLGMNALYVMLLPIITMLLFMTVCRQTRDCWKTSGPYITAGTAFLLFLPHFIWIYQHDFSSMSFVMNKVSKGYGLSMLSPLRLIGSYLSPMVCPLISIVFLCGFPWKWRRRTDWTENEQARFNVAFLGTMIGIPFLVQFLYTLTGRAIPERMAEYFDTYIPLLILAFLKFSLDSETLRKSVKFTLVILFGVLLLAEAGAAHSYYFKSKLSRTPSRLIAQAVDRVWREHYGNTRCPFVAAGSTGDDQFCVAASVSACGKLHTRTIVPYYSTDADLNREGGVVIWDADKAPNVKQADMTARFPRASVFPPILEISDSRPDLPPLHIGIAIVPPQTK